MDSDQTSIPTIKVNDCLIVGARAPNEYPRRVEVFHNIPYASTDRFSQASPIALGSSTSGPGFDASRPRRDSPDPGCTTSTLRLHITRPASTSTTSQQQLPVLIYFHGGGFNFGDPLETDSASFVGHAQTGIIVVGVEYRLAALGFLAGEGEANLGLKDQRVAVEWVHQWISVFGGDPALITLRGVSAGAHSVGHHILNPSRLPFSKAILESGSPTSRSVLSADHPRTIAQLNNVRAFMPPGPLKTAKVTSLITASQGVFARHMGSLTWPFQPVIDGPGGTIPDLPLNLWQQKNPSQSPRASNEANPLPAAVITGFCTSEGIEFIPENCHDFRAFFTKLIPSLTPSDLDTLETLYPPIPSPHGGAEGLHRRLGEAYGDYAYTCPIIHTAHMVSRLGGLVYLYEFAPLVSQSSHTASHASHADAVTRSMGDAQYPGLLAVSRAMHSRWTEFVSSPDGVLGEDTWPPFVTPFGEDNDGTKGKLLVFGQGNDEGIGGRAAGISVQTRTLTEREKEVCKFWWDRMELSQGTGNAGVVSKAY